MKATGNAKPEEKVRHRRRLSKRVSQLALKSGLDTSHLNLSETESAKSAVFCCQLLAVKNTERPKHDPIYQTLRTLEEIHVLISEEIKEENILKLTAAAMKLRYAVGFGLETQFQQIDLRSKVTKYNSFSIFIEDRPLKKFLRFQSCMCF